MHVWEIALQWRPQAVSYTIFYWLCMLCQDCSPFRPGTVFMSTQWRTWLVADHDWSPTLPYFTVLATATDPQGGRHNSNLATNNTFFLLMNTPFDTRQVLFVLDWTPEQEPVRGLWGAKTQLCTANAFLFVCQQQQLTTRVSPYLEEKKQIGDAKLRFW